MTLGAVIAREYGVPTLVGVVHATQLMRDGRQVCVRWTEMYVELLF
jgi:pyruvate,water dikinase